MAKSTKKAEEKKPAAKASAPVIPKYPKEEILKSDQFNRMEIDFLAAVLPDNMEYTVTEARNFLKNKLKEAVK